MRGSCSYGQNEICSSDAIHVYVCVGRVLWLLSLGPSMRATRARYSDEKMVSMCSALVCVGVHIVRGEYIAMFVVLSIGWRDSGEW